MVFHKRVKEHDKLEAEVMNIIRPYTTRKHLPDRWIALRDIVVPWDFKSNIFVEDNSHDEYFRLLEEGYKPFIVYRDKKRMEFRADWIQNLIWTGPFPASQNSTSGDDYYRISGGRLLDVFLKHATREMVEGKDTA